MNAIISIIKYFYKYRKWMFAMKKFFILGMFLFTTAVCVQKISLEVLSDGTMILYTDNGSIDITALSKKQFSVHGAQQATIFKNDDFAYTSDLALEYQLRESHQEKSE